MADLPPPAYQSSSSFSPPPPYTQNPESKRVLSGVLAIVLGALGVHKFVLGYHKEGAILLAATVLTCGIGAAFTSMIGLAEGVLYLTKSDAEFVSTYQTNRRGWF